MQCDARYEVYDTEGKMVVTYFCLKEKGHDGPHEHLLVWKNNIHADGSKK
jgi:hypothetical protein